MNPTSEEVTRYWKNQGEFYQQAAELIEKKGEDYAPLVKINYQNAISAYENGKLFKEALGLAIKIDDRNKIQELEEKLK
ncbi:MAG: hypothetical protein WCK29_02000 [archaeon]